MRTFIYSFLITFILGSYGCSIPRNVINPVQDTPSKYRGIAQADTTSIGNILVKDFFATKTIQQLIDSAIERNIDLQIAISYTNFGISDFQTKLNTFNIRSNT